MGFFVVLLMFLFVVILLISLAGIANVLVGSGLLIAHFVKNKKQKTKRFFVASIIMICVGIPMFALLPIAVGLAKSSTTMPTSVKVEGVTYKSGFYEDLIPNYNRHSAEEICRHGDAKDIVLKNKVHTHWGNKFYRVEFERFNLLHAESLLMSGEYYIEEGQWKDAQDYYLDGKNFNYFYDVYKNYERTTFTIKNFNNEKLNELKLFLKELDYVDEYSYRLDTFDFKAGEKAKLTELYFYKESNDWLFHSKDYSLEILNGELVRVLYTKPNDDGGTTLKFVRVEKQLNDYLLSQIELK